MVAANIALGALDVAGLGDDFEVRLCCRAASAGRCARPRDRRRARSESFRAEVSAGCRSVSAITGNVPTQTASSGRRLWPEAIDQKLAIGVLTHCGCRLPSIPPNWQGHILARGGSSWASAAHREPSGGFPWSRRDHREPPAIRSIPIGGAGLLGRGGVPSWSASIAFAGHSTGMKRCPPRPRFKATPISSRR